MSKRLLSVYENTVLAYPRLVLVLVLALAAAMAVGMANFRIDASADALTLEYDDDLDYFREINQRYGSTDILVVTYRPKGGDLFSDQSLATLEALTRELGNIPGVTNVQSLINVPLLFSPKIEIADLKNEPRTLLTPGVDRAAAKREFETSPVYRDLILGPDGQTTGIVATLAADQHYLEMVRRRDALRLKERDGDLSEAEAAELAALSDEFREYRTALDDQNRQRVDNVRALMDSYRDRAELFLGGASMISADIVDYVASDMVVFGIGVVLFIIVTLAAIFRQPRWVVLPFAACALAVVIMLGALGWLDWRLTVISSNFVLVLLIIAIAVSIHLVVRYRELHWRHPDWPQVRLVRETVASMFIPCLYTVLTTMVAFGSLVVSNIRPVIDFGWMMTAGLVVAFVLVFLLIPAGIMAWGMKPVAHRPSEDAPLTLLFSRFTERFGKTVVVTSLVLAMLSIWGISRLQVDNRFIDYFRKSTEIYQGLSVIDANLGGTTPFDIVIRKPEAAVVADAGDGGEASGDEYGAGDPFAPVSQAAADEDSEDPFAFEDDPFASDEAQAPENSYWFTLAGLEQLEKLHNYLETVPEIGKVNSLVTAFHTANELTGTRLNDFELAFMRQTLSPAINDFLIAPYIDDATGETRLSMRTVETASDLKRADLLAQLHRFMQEEMGLEPGEYRFSGLLVLYNNLLQSLYQSQILTIGAVFLGIMFMFMVLFRSLTLSVIAVAPNLLAAGVVLGGMGLVGLPLDMMTITIAAITVGIGVDDTIHYIHRFRHEFAEDRNYLATMHRAHASIGRAMYYTSIIIIVGFSILTLSNFKPSIYFGLLTGVAMLAALLGAMVLLPKLILIIKPFGPEESPNPVR
ncbi:MAG: MMPL family transporter [Pseudomonadota bacterium]|nr:MMPL family transporter [Pseudomonadota bacterium]